MKSYYGFQNYASTQISKRSIAFIIYGMVLYVSYLKEVLGKLIPSYKTVTYAALAILIVCMVWAVILEYSLQY